MSGKGSGRFLSPDDALGDSESAVDLHASSAPQLPMQSYSYTSLDAGHSSGAMIVRDWMSVQVRTHTSASLITYYLVLVSGRGWVH